MDKFWRPAMKDGSKKKESYVNQPYETRSGGFRVDENNVEFYLTPAQLAEYTRLNVEIKDDDEFWAAWKAMRERLGLKPYTKVYTYDDDWDKGEGWWSKSKKSTTDWWGSGYRSSMSWASNKTQKLAIALQHVISIVRTIDDNNPAMSVDWTSKGQDLSYTDFTKKRISISAEPVVNTKTTDAEALDIVTGYALHEASHALYTAPLQKTLTDPSVIHPMEVSALLANILEDPRVEGLTAKEYPGFAEYIEKALDYSWTKRPATANPAEWGNLGQKLNAVIVIARWAKNVRVEKWKTDAATTSLALGDASFDAEIPWFTTWLSDYMAGKTVIRDAVQAAIDHLMDKEMEKRIKESKAREEAGKKMLADILEQMKKLMEEMNIDSPCESMEGDPSEDGITPEDADAVQRLVESKTKEVHAPDGDHDPRTMFHSRPLETSQSQKHGRRKLSPIMQRLKAAIQLRPELPQFEDRLLRGGDLDEEELYRFAANDYRIFQQRIVQEHPQASVTLLVDMSGSMTGSATRSETKLDVAQELATLFVDALRSMEGVSAKVMGHTGDVSTGGEIQLYELWTKGDTLPRLGLIQTLPHANNYDGHAISWCVKDLLERARPNDQVVLIVLSDGQPAGSRYGGISGMDHVRKVTDKAEQRGVAVIQIAIDDSLRPAEQSRMFKHWIPFTTMDALPRAFEKVLARAINAS
jgi:Mg-chelatase subunit ChlD